MQTSVELQGPFYYSTLILIILGALVLIPAIIWIAAMLKNVKMPKFKKKVVAPPPKPVKIDKEQLRSKCFNRIREIERLLEAEKISRRQAYIYLSACVREFISKITNNNVSALTLKEITELNMPSLSSLIEQFYHPEFAFDDATEEEMTQAFEDARKVVKEWN